MEVYGSRLLSLVVSLGRGAQPHLRLTPNGVEMGGAEETTYLEIVALPDVSRGWIDCAVTISTLRGERRFRGFSKRDFARLEEWTSLLKHRVIEAHRAIAKERLWQAQAAVDNFAQYCRERFMKHSELSRWKSAHFLITMGERAFPSFVRSWLDSKENRLVDAYFALIADPEQRRREMNHQFIEDAMIAHADYFDQVETNPLTLAQRRACLIDEDHNLVLAGAGSGKTSVIVGKAGFIERMGWASADEILILAFGNKASKETEERIRAKLGKKCTIKVSTFHSLGLAVIGLATGKKPRVHKLAEGDQPLQSFVNQQVERMLESDSAYRGGILNWLSRFLYPVKEPDAFANLGEYYEHVRQHELRTFNGERVKSQQELELANFFFRNRIAYTYEEPYEKDVATARFGQYKPDFYFPEYGIYLEHYGLNKDGHPPKSYGTEGAARYLEGIQWKRETHAANETVVIETFSHQFSDGTIWQALTSVFQAHGIVLNPMSSRELLLAIPREEPIRKISRLIAGVIHLQKMSNLTEEELVALYTQGGSGRSRADAKRLKAFLTIYLPIYRAYTQELKKAGEVDFNDMIWSAVRCIAKGRFRSPWKYILVDEFQDISPARAELVRALLHSRNDVSLFCVGDDWQSIYRFTGSDLTYTTDFEQKFGVTVRTDLDMTFRFNQSISDTASRFVMQNPRQLSKEIQAYNDSRQPAVTVMLYRGNRRRAINRVFAQIRALSSGRPQPVSIYFLGRYRHLEPNGLSVLNRRNSQFTFSFDTIHASKGKEADYVILLDVNQGRFGFPSGVEDDPVLTRLLPQEESFQYAEERRLFYVALTRARHKAFVLAADGQASVFVQELLEPAAGYHCEVIDDEGVAVGEHAVTHCHRCRGGMLVQRVNSISHAHFYSCSNYPLCDGTARECPDCMAAPLVPSGESFSCPSCKTTVPQCPDCENGMLVKRKGKFGEFFGCTSYPRCSYTRNVESALAEA